ncbi:Ldh family oxidoreductase [Microbacterium sp. cf332]|uniref:Ldh family oxidoreductase n=1 Tax=Microbacterium sp. cf332 TaxID=1761804 RepID=UPI00088EF0D1|nr:Ldh family oxidoreductase [Microbacterium sp. cf332]SDQ64229.1 Malate/lactate/ureidoglycolate dehydrogenase, LDH2 family [Microbacterium sp. cf332]
MTTTGIELRRFATDVLAAAGMRRQNADVVAGVMVGADLLGVHSHGVARLSTYLERVDAGVMAIDPEMSLVRDHGATALLDAANSFGQLAASRAMIDAIERARAFGAGIVSVTRSNHFGVAGHYVRAAAEGGLVGIAMTNASPAMPPFNGTRRLLGTNPIAIGVPSRRRPLAVLDMSSTTVARGKIRRAFDNGETEIPAGWATGPAGEPTTDPAVALTGDLAPLGGPKGSGLSLMIDLLAGGLSGTGPVGSVVGLPDASAVSGTGHLLIALDPEAFGGADLFDRLVEQSLDDVAGMAGADGGRVFYPGLIEHEQRERAERDGIQLTDVDHDRLGALAARFGLDAPAR